MMNMVLETVPDIRVQKVGAEAQWVSTSEELAHGLSVLFTIPGAYTSTCSNQHLPSYIACADRLFENGVSRIWSVVVNDAKVVGAWAKSLDVPNSIEMIADGNADFVRALGLDIDFSEYGMGTRCKRSAIVVRDGRIVGKYIEELGEFSVSSAEHILEQLR